MRHFFLLAFSAVFLSCSSQSAIKETPAANLPVCGAAQIERYMPELHGKHVGLVANQTSRIGQTHLVDTLLRLGVDIKAVFAPEHGFRGEAGAGEHISDGKDPMTGIPVLSLYGKTKKPT
ncbi:MAG: exo-beta-N-acetylmuramidase NamZ domain-containing protein, partial [Flavobacteriales bacterium]